MTEPFFKSQVTRLRVHFGDRALSDEFLFLAWDEVRDMSEIGFKRQVDIWIGSRRPVDSPMIAEFREARLYEVRQTLKSDVITAAKALVQHRPLKEILEEHFGPVKGALGALNKARASLLRGQKS